MARTSLPSRRPAALAVALVSALIAALTLGGAAVPAFAATTHIGGTVTNQMAVALQNVVVQAYDGTGTVIAGSSAITNATGGFVLDVTGNAGDSVYLQYTPSDTSYAQQWYGGAAIRSQSTPVVLTGGSILRNASLNSAATIAGTVTGAALRPLGGIQVSAIYNSTFDLGDATTAADGTYTIGGLNGAHGYQILFNDPTSRGYTTQWYDNSASQGLSTPVTPTVGQHVTGIGAHLVGTASIHGLVLTAGSMAISGVHVIAEYPDGGSAAAVATTDGTGQYTLIGLPGGSFTMVYSKSGYVSQLYNGHPVTATGDTVATTANNQTNAGTVHLVAGATISGTVSDTGGNPIGGLTAVLYLSQLGTGASLSNLVATASIGANGVYTFGELPTGDYKVGITTDPAGYDPSTGALLPSDPYVSGWYTLAYSYSNAVAISVTTAGAAVTGKDVVLQNPTFADVSDPTSTFYTDIQWMAANGISTGTPQPSGKPLYKPVDSVSRQAMAAFIYRLSGATFSPPADPTFQDVPTTSTFYTAIEWMSAQGIATGTPVSGQKPLYKPVAAVSRQAMALFLARYTSADLSTPPTTQDFADVPVTASSAAAIHWMFANGISTGTPQPSGLPLYKPLDPVSRQAMAAFLYRVAHLPSMM